MNDQQSGLTFMQVELQRLSKCKIELEEQNADYERRIQE